MLKNYLANYCSVEESVRRKQSALPTVIIEVYLKADISLNPDFLGVGSGQPRICIVIGIFGQ